MKELNVFKISNPDCVTAASILLKNGHLARLKIMPLL